MIDGRGQEPATSRHGARRQDRARRGGVGQRGRSATYELGTATLLPGLIDAHVHPGWYINRQGALHNDRDGDTPAQSALARAGNLYATLMAGFTTIQSVGGPEDLDLRDAVERWQIPGPRILTSITQINNRNLSPDSLRGIVRRSRRAAPTSSSSSRRRGSAPAAIRRCPTSSSPRSVAKQSRRACARSSTRSAREAFVPQRWPAAPRSSTARSRRDAELKLMAEQGTIFDPQVCLVFQNYIDHRDVYARSGFTERRSIALANGDSHGDGDVQAGARDAGAEDHLRHGRRRARARATTPTSCSVACAPDKARWTRSPPRRRPPPTALGLGDQLGAIAPGFDADLIAVRGDPSEDIAAIRKCRS